MIKVFFKSDEEMERDAYGWNGRPCGSYVITAKNEKIATDELNEKQILSFVWQGIMAAVTEKKNQEITPENANDFNAMHYEGSREVANLLFVVNDSYQPTLDGMRTYVDLLYHQDQTVRGFANNLLIPTMRRGRYDEIVNIASYLKHARGAQTSELNRYELQSVITQMQTNDFTIPVDHLLGVCQ